MNEYLHTMCHQGDDGPTNLHHDSIGSNPHVLIKFVSLLFECDFFTNVEICCVELYNMYLNKKIYIWCRMIQSILGLAKKHQ